MRFEWFVARRYLRSPNRPAVLRLVTLFSVLGVAAGVATLVIALAMNTGFRETLQDRLLGVTAHISLTRPGLGGIHNYQALAEETAAIPGVRSVTPGDLPDGAAVVRGRGARRGDERRRRQSAKEEATKRCRGCLRGSWIFRRMRTASTALLVGKQLADEWKIAAGRLRDADKSARKTDAVWIDSADAAISGGRNVRFRLLRLRRKLVLRDAAGGAIAGGQRATS